MAGSIVSRRVSEFFGVALFAAALIWLIALATYEPTDPVWFFSAGSAAQPANFAGRVGAFLAELSFQLLGYASHLIPAAMVVLGWHYFWCRTLDAQYTKLVGAGLLFGCVSSLLSLAFGSVDVDGKPSTASVCRELGKCFRRLDFCQRHRPFQRLDGRDIHDRQLARLIVWIRIGIARRFGYSHNRLLIAGVVKKYTVPFLNAVQMLLREGIPDAGPRRAAVFGELLVAVARRFFFEQPIHNALD